MYTTAQLRFVLLRLVGFFSFGLCLLASEAWAEPLITDITVTMRDALGSDVNGDGLLNPGDSIVYTVQVSNRGTEAASGLVFVAEPDALTPLVLGSVRTPAGQVAAGNNPSSSTVRVALDRLPGGATTMFTFEVQLLASAARPSSGVVSATATVQLGESKAASDDPDSAAANDPTTTEVIIPTPANVAPSPTYALSGGGLGGCTVSPGGAAPAPLLLLGVAVGLLALLRRRAQRS